MPVVLSYASCNVSILPVRKEPLHDSEQVTQLLFGEKLEIEQVNNRDWAKIRCAWDDYEGWCKQSQLTLLTKKEYRKEVKYLSGSHKGKLELPSGDMYIPFGSELDIKGGAIAAGYETGHFKGSKLKFPKQPLDGNNIKNAALQYLNAPYQWGGRSVWGIDCSGLSQMAFKLCNYKLPRDAKDQALTGQSVDFLVHARCGDLAFFENKDGIINHVGILLDNETILHATDASGRVVIDRIDQGGIISLTLKKRTHTLRMVRRIISGSAT